MRDVSVRIWLAMMVHWDEPCWLMRVVMMLSSLVISVVPRASIIFDLPFSLNKRLLRYLTLNH